MTSEGGRQLNEMALSAGRNKQSTQTGYVHYCYHDLEENVAQTIPVVENTYFVLALLRSKTAENMREAKDLLNQLLFFQNPEGNFPIYLHEYPQAKDRFLGAQLLPTYFYILEEFQTVLGSELKQRLEQTVTKLLTFALQALEEKAPSYGIGIKLAASAKVLGCFLKEKNFQQKGEQLLDHYFRMRLNAAWLVQTTLAEICVALQMVYTQIQKSPWQDFWQHLSHTWHDPTATYIGPGLKQYQDGFEPQSTLYDLFLGYFSNNFSTRALKEAPYHLQAVLIRPTGETLPSVTYPLRVVCTNLDWLVYQEEKFAYSLIDKAALQNAAYENAFHFLNLIWGTKERVHSFVSQGGNFEEFHFKAKGNEIELQMQLTPTFELEDREKCREIIFFFDIEPDVNMTIHGETATTFDLAEEFKLKTPEMHLSIEVIQTHGEGQFLGHLMQGNRCSQTQLKGLHRFKAYDWQLFYRTLRRNQAVQFKAKISINPCIS